MVCQPHCALAVRIVEKHFSEPISLLKTGRVLTAPASLPRGTPALCRHVGLRPTPEDGTQHARAQQASCGPAGKAQLLPRATAFLQRAIRPGRPLLSALPSDSLICSHGFSNPMHVDHPDLSSDTLPASLVQPSATPGTAQNRSGCFMPRPPATQSVHSTCPFTPLLIPCEIFPIHTPALQGEVATSNRQCPCDISVQLSTCPLHQGVGSLQARITVRKRFFKGDTER